MFHDDTLLGGRIERAAVAALRESMKAPVRVVFLAGLHADSRAGFHAACQAAGDDPIVKRVSRVNGREHIKMWHGGQLSFFAASSGGHRFVTAEVLFVAEHLMHMEDTRSSIFPMVATGGRIITF